jgi:hypothetical protein
MDIGVVVDRKSFVSRSEKENAATATMKRAPAAKYFPSFVPRQQISSSNVGMSKGSPYISDCGTSKLGGKPSAIGWDGWITQTRSKSPSGSSHAFNARVFRLMLKRSVRPAHIRPPLSPRMLSSFSVVIHQRLASGRSRDPAEKPHRPVDEFFHFRPVPLRHRDRLNHRYGAALGALPRTSSKRVII